LQGSQNKNPGQTTQILYSKFWHRNIGFDGQVNGKSTSTRYPLHTRDMSGSIAKTVASYITESRGLRPLGSARVTVEESQNPRLLRRDTGFVSVVKTSLCLGVLFRDDVVQGYILSKWNHLGSDEWFPCGMKTRVLPVFQPHLGGVGAVESRFATGSSCHTGRKDAGAGSGVAGGVDGWFDCLIGWNWKRKRTRIDGGIWGCWQ
jgi:hypothetical protein